MWAFLGISVFLFAVAAILDPAIVIPTLCAAAKAAVSAFAFTLGIGAIFKAFGINISWMQILENAAGSAIFAFSTVLFVSSIVSIFDSIKAFIGVHEAAIPLVIEEESLINNAYITQYPPNNGAVLGTEKTIELEIGKYGRYGEIGPNSNYITNAGATSSQLSLPPRNNGVYTEITVIKPIPNVVQSTVAPCPHWGGVGGGIQYLLPKPILELVKLGFIVI